MKSHSYKNLVLNKRHARWILVLLLAVSTLVIGACSTSSQPGGTSGETSTFGLEKNSSKLQVGVVTVGPVSDWGWNYQQNQARLALEARLRGKVRTVLAENVPETANAQRVMERMASEGAKVIFSTSYGYSDFCLRAAKEYPKVVFMQAQAPISAPNANTYNARIWEASYVTGVVAAMVVKKDTHFGFVGAQPIPPINWTVNSFALGARSVNPKVTVDIVYTNSWNNPAAETEAVNSLVAQGVKVVYILVDSPIAGVQAAEQAGIYSISHHADLSSFAPKGYLTGAMWDWTPVYVDVAKEVMAGTWKSHPMIGGFKEGYVKLAPFGPAVDDAARKKARDTIAEIESGKLRVFEGPVYDNKGALKVPRGETLPDSKIVSMDWLVQGVRAAK